MIKVTVGQIVNAVPVLSKLVNEIFLGRKAFMVARLVREINKEGETFEMARAELIKKYGTKNENGELIITDGNIRIPAENLDACNDELSTLQHTDVEINAEKLPIDWLDDIGLTLSEAAALEPFVDF